MKIPFVKAQNIGNDFVIINSGGLVGVDWASAAVKLCRRQIGIGSDGLLLVEQTDDPTVVMKRMFNPDGTEDFCGNGLLCLGLFALKNNLVRPDNNRAFTIRTINGDVTTQTNLNLSALTATLKPPSFNPSEIPINHHSPQCYDLNINNHRFSAVTLSTGTTHTVLFVDELPDDSQFFSVSPILEQNPMFPQRTSVLWTQRVNEHALKLRIWERGVGETLGCGTGACASAVAAITKQFCESPVNVASKGGKLNVEWRDDGFILMEGEPQLVFSGQVDLDV